ncbi:MAG: hypothetical protein CNLJKLNK_00201 [Holosporales bacterium]
MIFFTKLTFLKKHAKLARSILTFSFMVSMGAASQFQTSNNASEMILKALEKNMESPEFQQMMKNFDSILKDAFSGRISKEDAESKILANTPIQLRPMAKQMIDEMSQHSDSADQWEPIPLENGFSLRRLSDGRFSLNSNNGFNTIARSINMSENNINGCKISNLFINSDMTKEQVMAALQKSTGLKPLVTQSATVNSRDAEARARQEESDRRAMEEQARRAAEEQKRQEIQAAQAAEARARQEESNRRAMEEQARRAAEEQKRQEMQAAQAAEANRLAQIENDQINQIKSILNAGLQRLAAAEKIGEIFKNASNKLNLLNKLEEGASFEQKSILNRAYKQFSN